MRCPACQRSDLTRFFEMEAVPVFANVLYDSAEEARDAPRGDIRLGLCPACGLLYNEAFDASALAYSPAYENSLHFSPHFQQWAEALAARLVADHALTGKTVLEIGCGKGDFLSLLCAAGCARGIGFDESFDPALFGGELPPNLEFVQAPFSEVGVHHPADLICSRHVLEHVPEPAGFLASLAKVASLRADAVVYVEVPNALFTLRDLGIWDLIYEHCAYWSPVALEVAFRSAGFAPAAVTTTYGDQFLSIEGRRATGADAGAAGFDPAAAVEALSGLTRSFADSFAEKTSLWSRDLEQILGSGRRVALWGGGSKGVTFLNALPEAAGLAGVVDINPRKQGRFVPGTGQPVLAPSSLREAPVDLVLVMNPLYADEIRGSLRELGSAAEVRVV